jgi:hypothetical protein
VKTKDARSLPASAQEAIRIKAVKAVLSGKSQLEVAALFAGRYWDILYSSCQAHFISA